MSQPSEAPLLERIERLERTVAGLTTELHELRAASAATSAEQAAPQPGVPGEPVPPMHGADAPGDFGLWRNPGTIGEPAPPPQPWRPTRRRAVWTADEVEGVVGRYGMLVLATVTGLAAVGTFLGWAIAQGLLGPTVRVALGFLLAAALAGTGAWMRPRERSFGAALLGIALAVVHVCGWAISPANLALVPAWAALTLTVLASAALAMFAHGEEDEPLWCVGFGGAAIAPFVTSGDSGSVAMLSIYAGAVLLLGSWALRRREWPIAGRVLTASVGLYVVALLATPHDTGSPLMALALPIVVAGAGVLPFASPRLRRGRLRMLGALAAISAVAAADSGALPVPGAWLVAAIAGTGLAWLLILDWSADLPSGSLLEGLLGEGGTPWDWVDAAAIPLVLLGAAVGELGPSRQEAMAAAVATAAFAAFVSRRAPGALRDASVLALCIAALVATWEATQPLDEWSIAALAVVAAGFAAGCRWRAAWPWIAMAGATLALCSATAARLLLERTAYEYVPFATTESAIAAVVAASWFATERLMRPVGDLGAMAFLQRDGSPRVLPVVAWVWAFAWVHAELMEAFSPTASTLLIISYYAATSVVTVWVGRTRGIPAVRHVGLVLALLAAGAAARGAADLDEVWARVAGYLVTSAFLLALAWWYRRADIRTLHT